MNPLSELHRFRFVEERDGHEKAVAFAVQAYKAYKGRMRTLQKKYKKHYPYRSEMIQARYSLRYILRTY